MKYIQEELLYSKYRSDIDGLRAIAVLSVVAFHAFPSWIKGGFIGVDVFFVISGYLISLILFENLDKGTFSFFEFYCRRVRRIFPALLIVLINTYVIGWFVLMADEYKQLGKHIAAGAGFISNFVLMNEAAYFDNAAETKPLLHLWSLGIEEQFYIVWPMLLWFAWKQNLNLLTITIVATIASFILNLKGIKQDIVATFYSPGTRVWELLSGSLIAWFTLYKKCTFTNIIKKLDSGLSRVIYREKQQIDGQALADVISFIGFSLLLYGLSRINKDLHFPGKWALVPVIGTILIILAGSKASINRFVLSNKIAVWFGSISFPLYLYHWPLLSFARIIEGEVPSSSIRIAIVLVCIALAWLTYKFVERPIRFGKKYNAMVAVLSVNLIFIGVIGYSTFYNDGFEFRNSIKLYINNKNELVRTPTVDEECIKYTGLLKPLFPYCRFTNVNSKETIAVIGDSHAHVAYPGIAEYLKDKGINTVLLANSSCPPFLGSYTGTNEIERNACKKRIEQLLETVNKRNEIKKIFIFTRGPTYNTGTEPLTRDKDLTGGNNIPIKNFVNSAQLSIDFLSKDGRLIYYVTENPELSYHAGACLERPFKLEVKNCSVDKKLVLERQADYLEAFLNLKNVTIINSLNAFCPMMNCLVFDQDGSILYADADHLSVAGSRFQVNKLLKPYLN